MLVNLHFLIADETEVVRPSASFFCYAGLVLDPVQLVAVDAVVVEQRRSLGLVPTELFKFSERAKPERITRDAWKDAKNTVLAALVRAGVSLIALFVHSRIAAGGQREHWSFDNLVLVYNDFLSSCDSNGIVIFDHSDVIQRDEVADIVSGVTTIGAWRVSAPRVLGVATTHVEWLHAAAAADIAIGSLRYCLEHPTYEVSRAMFSEVSHLLWTGGEQPPDGWMGHGCIFLPLRMREPLHRREYKALRADLQHLYSESTIPF